MSTQTMIPRKQIRAFARELVRVHAIENGSVILMKSGLMSQHEAGRLTEILARMGYPNVVLLYADNLDDISLISDERMNAVGWCRCEE